MHEGLLPEEHSLVELMLDQYVDEEFVGGLTDSQIKNLTTMYSDLFFLVPSETQIKIMSQKMSSDIFYYNYRSGL